MNKVKMLVLAAVAAATVGVGALGVAPSASAATALPPNCFWVKYGLTPHWILIC